MRRFVVGFLATVGVLSIVLVAGLVIGGFWLSRSFGKLPELPERMALTLDLRHSLPETSSLDPLATLAGEPVLNVAELVQALERAATDPRVAGLLARLDATDHGLAVAQELRAAVHRLGQSGRFTTAWADSFGELGPGNEGYYIATAFQEIALQPVGMLGLTGLAAEVPFIRPLLDRLGIEPAIVRRAEYKTALDSAVETGLTPAHREMLNDMLDRLYDELVRGIAAGRDLAAEAVERLIDAGPLSAEDALAGGLVDRLAYNDEVEALIRSRAGEGAELVELSTYARGLSEPEGEASAVAALIIGEGAIQRGSTGFETAIGADDLAAALAEAREDGGIDVVVLRLDTGGGSAVASETIGREVRLLHDAGKPVIVSMGNAAASGGYWIAMGASHIVAQPATLTGSIGVLAGKPVLAEAWDQLGVNWAVIERGRNAGFLSINRPFDALGQARLEASVDAMYERFKAGVAAGRGLSPETVESVARGRVWLGQQALELGLVDELGGLVEARAAAGRLLDLPPEATIELRRYPPPPSTLERLRGLAHQPWLAAARSAATWLITAANPAPARALLPGLR